MEKRKIDFLKDYNFYNEWKNYKKEKGKQVVSAVSSGEKSDDNLQPISSFERVEEKKV